MKTREIQWKPKKRKISQVASRGLEYAFLSKDYEQVHQLVYCKDFMQDAIHSHIHKQKSLVWGFKYDPETDLPLYLDSTRLLVANRSDNNFRTSVQNCITFLNKVEEDLKMDKTTLEECSNPSRFYRKTGAFIFEGSNRWMKSGPMISMYTLFIRLGMGHNPKETWKETIEAIEKSTRPAYYPSDRGFLTSAKNGIQRILEEGDRKIFGDNIEKNFPATVSAMNIHNYFGLVAFSQGQTKQYKPEWYN